MIEGLIEEYAAARRDLLALWTAKHRLLLVAFSRFPKSHALFKSIARVCHNDATCQIRHCATKLFVKRPIDTETISSETERWTTSSSQRQRIGIMV